MKFSQAVPSPTNDPVFKYINSCGAEFIVTDIYIISWHRQDLLVKDEVSFFHIIYIRWNLMGIFTQNVYRYNIVPQKKKLNHNFSKL